MQYLLAITFVYGVVRLLTFTKLFSKSLVGIIESIFTEPSDRTLLGVICIMIDFIFFYFSLVFQSWYWLFDK